MMSMSVLSAVAVVVWHHGQERAAGYTGQSTRLGRLNSVTSG